MHLLPFHEALLRLTVERSQLSNCSQQECPPPGERPSFGYFPWTSKESNPAAGRDRRISGLCRTLGSAQQQNRRVASRQTPYFIKPGPTPQSYSAGACQVNRRSERWRAISSGEEASQPLRLPSTRSKASIYGLMSSRGVPSSTSMPRTVRRLPRTSSNSTMERPIGFGREGAGGEDSVLPAVEEGNDPEPHRGGEVEVIEEVEVAEPFQVLQPRLAGRVDHHGADRLPGPGGLDRHSIRVGEGGVDGADGGEGDRVLGFHFRKIRG